MAPPRARLNLLTRPGCGLCEEMARDLSRLGVAFDTIDIEANETLEAVYGEVIPILRQGEVEIARAPQDVSSLRRALKRAGLL